MWSERQIVFDSSLCRFCGTLGKKLHNIQSSDDCNEGNSICQLIRRLVPLKIDPEDRKPQQVCNDCIGILEKYDALISTCLANDINFDNILQSIKTAEGDSVNEYKTIECLQEKWKSGNEVEGNSEIADQSVQNDNFYIIVELNCKGVNIDPVLLRCNENKNQLPAEKENEIELTGAKTMTGMNAQTVKKTDKVKPFKCTICNKSLTRKSNLVSHLALHSEERPHKCNECGKNFAIHADLTLHKHIHTQLYSCIVCKKCFVTKSKLERHAKSHTGVKEHPCPICKKRFAEKNNMMAHMSVHTGEKPFSCNICKKSFRTQSHLTDHGRVHSAESPFKCPVCKKSFKWKSNLKDHSKYHSGEKFKCTDCGKEFSIRTDYYKHRKECRQLKYQVEENAG